VPVGGIDTIVVDGLKALDPEWPIREATLFVRGSKVTLRADFVEEVGEQFEVNQPVIRRTPIASR
jgi:hypothetical protein